MAVKVGDRVCYTQAACQTISAGDPHSDVWWRKGEVVELDRVWVYVLWEGDAEPTPVKPCAIAAPGSDAACRIDSKGWVGYEALGEKRKVGGLWK